jgi:hypothetical protein
MNKNKIEGFHKDAPIDMTNQYMIFGHKICVIFLFYKNITCTQHFTIGMVVHVKIGM